MVRQSHGCRVIQLTTTSIESLMAAARELEAQGRHKEAAAAFQRVVAMNPRNPEALHRLGAALARTSDPKAGVSLIQQSLQLDPQNAQGHRNLGTILTQIGQPVEGAGSLRQAAELAPNHPDIQNELAVACHMAGDIEGAIAAFRRAIALEPKAEFYNNIAIALERVSKTDEALAAYQEAIRLNPVYAGAISNLGTLLQARGQMPEAMAMYRESLSLAASPANYAKLLFSMNYVEGVSASEIYRDAREWAQLYADPLTFAAAPHQNVRDPDRPLRIGYLSPDFCSHPVARMLLAWIGLQDRSRYEITCYSNAIREDDVTQALRGRVQRWRPVTHLSDEQAAELIRQDGIDILVDLAMHAAGGRPLLLARKPAPVQINYLAYTGTTGMQAMDYRLSDPFIDPAETDFGERIYSEKTLRLPTTYWCVPPAGPEADLPQTSRQPGPIIFGCLNNFAKVSPQALQTWAKILEQVPDSRLDLRCPEGSHRQQVFAIFAARNIAPERIRFHTKESRADYFRILHGFDIALDPFPFSGGATTCDTLWMGVPVMTLRGERAIARGGVSILSNVGLPDLIADSTDQYVEKAVALARDSARLQNLRATLRQKMQASPLMDAQHFVRDLESAYRAAWRVWCGV